MADLPSFAELPAKPGKPARSAWGLWGDDDELGCLNLLTPERIAAAAKLVQKGAVFSLNLRIDQPDPPLYGRGRVKHTIVGEGGNGRDDYLDNFWPQAASQWDSLRHIRHPEHGWYNGVRDDQIVAGDGGKLGIDVFARKGSGGSEYAPSAGTSGTDSGVGRTSRVGQRQVFLRARPTRMCLITSVVGYSLQV
jgi:hypothetical protein